MRSNYKKLGQFIRVVDTRNKENRKDNLLGVSTQKVFIDSVANTVGTDFKKYKIVKNINSPTFLIHLVGEIKWVSQCLSR